MCSHSLAFHWSCRQNPRLIFKLTVWDDAAGKKLNDEPEQITVLENLDGDTIVGSGLTKSAEEQLQSLSEKRGQD